MALEDTFIDLLHKSGQIKSSIFSININHIEQTDSDSLYIGGWDPAVVEKEEDINWYTYFGQFSLGFDYIEIEDKYLMLDIKRRIDVTLAIFDVNYGFISLPHYLVDFVMENLNKEEK